MRRDNLFVCLMLFYSSVAGVPASSAVPEMDKNQDFTLKYRVIESSVMPQSVQSIRLALAHKYVQGQLQAGKLSASQAQMTEQEMREGILSTAKMRPKAFDVVLSAHEGRVFYQFTRQEGNQVTFIYDHNSNTTFCRSDDPSPSISPQVTMASGMYFYDVIPPPFFGFNIPYSNESRNLVGTLDERFNEFIPEPGFTQIDEHESGVPQKVPYYPAKVSTSLDGSIIGVTFGPTGPYQWTFSDFTKLGNVSVPHRFSLIFNNGYYRNGTDGEVVYYPERLYRGEITECETFSLPNEQFTTAYWSKGSPTISDFTGAVYRSYVADSHIGDIGVESSLNRASRKPKPTQLVSSGVLAVITVLGLSAFVWRNKRRGGKDASA